MQQSKYSSLWRARSRGEIAWAHFGKDYIAFHRPSGKTHFLNEASYHLICDVLTEARDLGSIAREFATNDSEVDPETFTDQMRSMLEYLRVLGLVDRV